MLAKVRGTGIKKTKKNAGWVNMGCKKAGYLDRVISEVDSMANGAHDPLVPPAARHALKTVRPQSVHADVQKVEP